MKKKPPNSVSVIRSSLQLVIKKLNSENAEETAEAMKEYDQLVNRFYDENKDFMPHAQYRAAKKDVQYFTVLVELAGHYYEQCNF
jgi:hypothetical protein